MFHFSKKKPALVSRGSSVLYSDRASDVDIQVTESKLI